jgi:hypothetical protein
LINALVAEDAFIAMFNIAAVIEQALIGAMKMLTSIAIVEPSLTTLIPSGLQPWDLLSRVLISLLPANHIA